ncbi:uncharacterized protein LOC132720995 [Ruditapes philippinarum]|uniref:uncharacterized protein LOC132720995 n=1 Tax=Ruditapes philippinarum TaxID=129788 RepID=UPI00295B947F|nr:uncharacterized protein LOC132720995 [Ruditapes philippinarum]
MMADLIRTSMFCDVNNVIIEGDQQYSGDDLYDTCSVNFMEFMTRTSDNFDDVSMDTDVFVEQEQQQLCQQTTPQNDVTDNTCKVSVATPEICQNFLSRIAEASKVDYSTFNNEAPSDVFCNNYLLPVVAQKQTILEQIPTCESKPEASAKFARPPYSYAACAVAAMYLIGNSSACANDILDKICSVFDDMKACKQTTIQKTTL